MNLAGEATKNGYAIEDLEHDFEQLLQLPSLNIVGLMCIPPAVESSEHARPWFVRLRDLRDQLKSRFGHPLPGLSMGMSGDYEVAIEEGSTIVRVGSAIFGARNYA